jgi:hypothetical protein
MAVGTLRERGDRFVCPANSIGDNVFFGRVARSMCAILEAVKPTFRAFLGLSMHDLVHQQRARRAGLRVRDQSS